MKAASYWLIATALLTVSSLNAEEKVKEHPTRTDVVGMDGGDAEMLAAQKRARDTLKQFIEALQKRDKNKRYLLKVRLAEGENAEHVWLEPVKWNNPGLLGILAVDPVALKKKNKGDIIAPRPDEVTDWVILSEDGSKQGGFTADVIEKRKSKK